MSAAYLKKTILLDERKHVSRYQKNIEKRVIDGSRLNTGLNNIIYKGNVVHKIKYLLSNLKDTR